MKSTTKQIIVIILASLSILACLFKGGQSIIKEMNPDPDPTIAGVEREEVTSFVKALYGDSIDDEKLESVLDNANKTNYKLLAVAIVLDIILIILAVRNIVNNRNSIIVFGLFSAMLTPSLLGYAMGITLLVISLMPSYDKQYQKQIAPTVEPVNTCKTIAYVILFSIVYIFFYCGIFSLIFKWLNLVEFMQTYSILINAVMFSIMFLVIFLMLRKEIIRDIKLFFKNFSTYLNISTPIFILGFIAQILIGITLILITKTKPANQASVTNMPIWFLIVFAIVIGPAVEEGFFRGFLGKFIKNKTTFIIVSSLLFSVMHVIPYAFFSPVQWVFVLQYAAVAVPISLVYAKTNNIATSYFFHLCWNSISLLTTAIALM